MIATQFKLNDVYSFCYNDEVAKAMFSPYHCFDGKFIVRKRDNGKLYLLDTYWASKHNGFENCGDCKGRTFQEAEKQGTLTFICNLDEVEEITEYDLQYYADEDVFNLSYQHGCCKYFVKRKGAERSKEKMLESVKEKINDAEYRKYLAETQIERHKKTLKKLEDGDLTVYI